MALSQRDTGTSWKTFQETRSNDISVSSVQFQVKLHTVADTVVLQRQLILEWPLALPLQHDLVRLTSDAAGDLGFEESCVERSAAIRT